MIIASNKYAMLSHESMKVCKHEKENYYISVIWLVSVIDYWNLGFICYLVLGLWNLYLAAALSYSFSASCDLI